MPSGNESVTINFVLLLLSLGTALVAAVGIGVALSLPIFLFALFLLSISGRKYLRAWAPDVLQSWPVLDKVLLGVAWVSALGFAAAVMVIGAMLWGINQ
jgi:hypothetical protein